MVMTAAVRVRGSSRSQRWLHSGLVIAFCRFSEILCCHKPQCCCLLFTSACFPPPPLEKMFYLLPSTLVIVLLRGCQSRPTGAEDSREHDHHAEREGWGTVLCPGTDSGHIVPGP